MKKLLLLLTILVSTLAHADRFGGSWKHHYVHAEGITFRLSFLESNVAPTYGLNYGGRVARKLYIDAWGNLDYKSIDYQLQNIIRGEVANDFTGTLIKDAYDHQYDALIVKDRYSSHVDYIWLEGNQQNHQLLEIKIEGRLYRFKLEL